MNINVPNAFPMYCGLLRGTIERYRNEITQAYGYHAIEELIIALTEIHRISYDMYKRENNE